MDSKLHDLENYDSGSNYKFGDKMEKASNPRSLFDLSHLNTLTMKNCGMLVPIALWETLPSDDFDINVDALLRVMPQVVPLYSRQRLYVYGFYSRYADLWNNWQVFMDKGYTGNVNKQIPILNGISGDSKVNFFAQANKIEPDSLLDYLGLPINATTKSLFGSESGDTQALISALPMMMYLRIYRDYFMNKNHWINDRVMLPDDDSRFRLNDNGKLMSALDENKEFYFCGSAAPTDSHPEYFDISISNDKYYFGGAYHDYPDDYFISALPFTQRGTAPSITQTSILKSGSVSSGISFRDNVTFKSFLASQGISVKDNDLIGLVSSPRNDGQNDLRMKLGSERIGESSTLDTKYYQVIPYVDTQITLEQIRKLAIEQIELERLARTDGSYREFGLSFFGETSKAAYDFRPTYIGGTYKNIAFTEVLQTSGSSIGTTDPQSTSPLGAYSGHGITGINSGRIGHIHCDDYGMIMLIACIMPDVYYSQGLDRIFTDSLQSDKFMPERVRLGMQPILNKELYYSGNNGVDIGEDNYLWAYQNPFDYLRYTPNKIHGKIADPTNNTFYPYTQSRKFDSLVNWGRTFASANKVRTDYLFSSEEDAYSAQFSINVRAVRPLPYKAIPAEIIN